MDKLKLLQVLDMELVSKVQRFEDLDKQEFIECTKCGKLIHRDDLKDHSKQHADVESKPILPNPLNGVNKTEIINDIQSWLKDNNSLVKPKSYSYLKLQLKFRFKNIRYYKF
jgi:hypothetical protein